jgi:phospholipase C
MAYLDRQDIPFHFALADAFTICDAYHCSFIGSTDPNRYYMWTGYTGNDGAGGGPVLGNDEQGYGWHTYPERLEQAGISWKIYQDIGIGLDAGGSWGWTDDAFIGNYGDNSLLYFKQYRGAAPGNPLYDKARTGTNVASSGGYFDILAADVRADRLPQVSWIVAPEAFTEHPNWPVNFGAWYIAKCLDALTANPEVWSKTALFITYDENDGFFDHLVPPYAPATGQGSSTVDVQLELFSGLGHVPGPYGLGQRVPMFVVSPWSTGGYVCSQTFDHTSIVQFMEARFGVREPNISPWRRAVCGDLTTAFDFSRSAAAVPALPNTDPDQPKDHDRHPDYRPKPPAKPALPTQEPGLRRARPLPYDLTADARVDSGLRIDFASHGAAGAHFLVTAAGAAAPWSYTVGPRASLSATIPVTGDFDVSVHGPNGFFRQIKGSARRGLDVQTRQQDDHVVLVLTNRGGSMVAATVSDGYGHEQAASYRIPARGQVEHRAGTEHGWYDLSVTTQSAGYLRRVAGHVETGRTSTSDPKFSR